MRAARILIKNFRGIDHAELLLPRHGVLIGDNNTGKTTVLEALDLALGPDRLNRIPPIDEHDFFRGRYLPEADQAADEEAQGGGEAGEPVPAEAENPVPVEAGEQAPPGEGGDAETPMIEIEVTVLNLSEEQKATFGDYVEFWDRGTGTFYTEPDSAGVDAAEITEALRVTFRGWYDAEEDDFEGRTYFTRSLVEADRPEFFSRRHKQVCGFLYLRSLRTGSRALSLERGSLLDIILRLKEVRPQMWEATLGTLAEISVASDPELGISPVLESINTALKKYVPKEWGVEPHLKVSNLSREHLRRVITAFIATGEGNHAAPFYRQGTGTINMLVLAMLSQIAEDRQNVIFAMEEPETAIPPYAQKRIVHEVRQLASQTIFTSHSPYVLEEFAIEETVVLERNGDGVLQRKEITLPANVKKKRYRQEFRTRFCEGLLARRVLLAEGSTEAAAFPATCRRLAELNSESYSSLEALGVCVVDAGGETGIPGMAQLYRKLGKRTFAICDNQGDENKGLIEAQVELLLMHDEAGFEEMVLNGTTPEALARFASIIDWPQHLTGAHPDPGVNPAAALRDYFAWSKGSWGIADFLTQCSENEIPEWLRAATIKIKDTCNPAPAEDDTDADPVDAVPEVGADGAE